MYEPGGLRRLRSRCRGGLYYAGVVSHEQQGEGLKGRLSRQGEDALGRLAEELAANSVVSSALAGAFDARERAVAAQEAAMGALGIPSAADIERLTRRVRSVSQRLEGIEDAIDRLDDRLTGLDRLDERLAALADGSRRSADEGAVEAKIDELRGEVGALREALAVDADSVPRAQERLAVSAEPEPPKRARSSGSGRRRSAASG